MFTSAFSEKIAWASIGETNQGGKRKVGRDGSELFMLRQQCPNLANIMYQVIRRKCGSLGYELPSTFSMNEQLKLARAVSGLRAHRDVDMSTMKDKTSRVEGSIPGAMFCDDLTLDAQVAYQEHQEDKISRYELCLTCADRKQLTKPGPKKRDRGVKDPAKPPIPRPNRRMNDNLKKEYDCYCAFAFKYHEIDRKVLQQVKNGNSFLDAAQYKDSVKQVSTPLEFLFISILVLFL
jgi:hypothetical protein